MHIGLLCVREIIDFFSYVKIAVVIHLIAIFSKSPFGILITFKCSRLPQFIKSYFLCESQDVAAFPMFLSICKV